MRPRKVTALMRTSALSGCAPLDGRAMLVQFSCNGSSGISALSAYASHVAPNVLCHRSATAAL